MFSLQQNWRTRGWNRFCPEVWGKVPQTMYTHVSKCKNNGTKKEREREREKEGGKEGRKKERKSERKKERKKENMPSLARLIRS
jgi:hypothetical protein